jgi:hypothetical protein
MRASTMFRFRAIRVRRWSRAASITATAIGTANASRTTMTSCFGVLIGEECSSVMVAAVGRGILAPRMRSERTRRGRRLERAIIPSRLVRGTAMDAGAR